MLWLHASTQERTGNAEMDSTLAPAPRKTEVNEADVFPQPLHAQNIFHSVQNFIRDTAARVPGVVNTEPSAPEPSAPATAGPSAFEDAWALSRRGFFGTSVAAIAFVTLQRNVQMLDGTLCTLSGSLLGRNPLTRK